MIAPGPTNKNAWRWCHYATAAALMAAASWQPPVNAQTVTATVNVNSALATMPEYGMGIHSSVYDNSLQYTGSPVFNQLDGLLDASGVNTLRYPGGGYADVYHFSLGKSQLDGGMVGSGLSSYWGVAGNFGYGAPKTDFGNFLKLLDATNSKTIITVNTGSAIKYDNANNRLDIPTHNGQPQEAAAWVAYANGNASLYGTANDIALGTDAEGNNWKTVGYWAKLRASTSTEYSTWGTAGGVYDAQNAFLAISHPASANVKYWEIGNENFGTAYYGGVAGDHGYALNYAVPYDGTARDDRPELSPAAYGQQVLTFGAAMKAVDPTIKIGAVLATPRTTASDASNPIGDYKWSYADLNNDGVKQADEPYWNDEVLSHTDATLGKVADKADFVIAHWYPGGSGNQIVSEPRLTIPTMLNGTTAGQDTGSNAGLRDNVANWRTDGNGNALEIMITETDGAGSTQTSDGLFAADAYATFLENGVSNVDWLELHNGSFLAEADNTANFAYWGIQSVHDLASVGDDFVATSTTQSAVRVHAAKRADGSVAVMIANMNAVSGGTRTVNVSINGDILSVNGVRYQTNGDTALSTTNLSNLGNSFSTSIAGRTLQVFILNALPAQPGDFNGDHIVDAADYTVWRDSVGESGADLAADANGDLAIDDLDYNVWTMHFGESNLGGGGVGGFAPVPEPSTLMLVMALGALALARSAAKRAVGLISAVNRVAC